MQIHQTVNTPNLLLKLLVITTAIVVLSAEVALIQERLNQILYLSKDVEQAVANFDITGLSPKEIFDKRSRITRRMAEDLHIKRHNFVMALTAGEINSLLQ